jgi:hypothetical protein
MLITFQPALFTAFFEEFKQNVIQISPIKKYYQIARFVLEVAYYQEDILFFEHSIAHLEIGPTKADFYIAVVSENDTEITPPNAFWDKAAITAGGIFSSNDNRYVAYYQQVYGIFQITDTLEKRAFYWMQHEEQLPEWERSFSFRNILHHFTENTNYCMLHAAGLGTNGVGVILPGKGGSGKSNTSLACVGSNILYLGDDFLLVDTESLTAFSLYNTAKIEQHRLPFFEKVFRNIQSRKVLTNGKMQFFLYPFFKDCLIKSFTIKAIVLPQFSGLESTTITSTSATESLKAMAPSTLGLLKASQKTFKKLAHIAQNVPVFILKTGTDLEQIPVTIASLLRIEAL